MNTTKSLPEMAMVVAYRDGYVEDQIGVLKQYAEENFKFPRMCLADFLDEAEHQMHWARQTGNEAYLEVVLESYIRGYADGIQFAQYILARAGVKVDIAFNIFEEVSSEVDGDE